MATGIAKRSGLAVAVALAAVVALLLSMTLPLWPVPDASASVAGISSNVSTVNAGAAGAVITIDAGEGLDADGLDNDGDGVADGADAVNESQITVLASTGTITVDGGLTATSCTGGTVACAGEAGSGTGTVTIPDGGNAIDIVQVTAVPPALGPATMQVTAIQNNVSKTVNITVRGTASKVELTAMQAAPTAGVNTCTGAAVATVIRAFAASANVGLGVGQVAAGILCTRVLDANNNGLPAATVIYSTDKGTFGGAGAVDIAAAGATTAGRAAASTLIASSTATAGSEATVTANSGGVTATTKVKFGGDPASCAITADPTSVTTGGSSVLTVDVKDSTGGPVPDNTGVAVVQVNPGAGANAAILGSPAGTTTGKASVTVIAAIPGAIALGATTPVVAGGGADVSVAKSCTTTVQATGTTVVPTASPTAAPGAVTVTPNSPYVSGANAVVVQGSGSAASIAAGIASSSGKTVLALWVLTGGQWIYFLPALPQISGGLSAFPGPVASAIVVLG